LCYIVHCVNTCLWLLQWLHCTQVTSGLPYGKECFQRNVSDTSVPLWKLKFHSYNWLLLLLAVYEGTDVYHTALHNHGLRSMDCTKKLQKKFADKTFSYARIKCKTIVGTNVCVLGLLKNWKMISNVRTLLQCLAMLLIISMRSSFEI
jgi:hypothetical protein